MSGIAPPRNVIYFNDGTYPLADIANLPYTDVIIGFLVPDDNLNLQGAGGAFDDNLQSNIQTLQNAGKNVLISVGGGDGFPSSAYQSYAQNVPGLVNQIVNNFVKEYGFNGVDIDYEDDAGFTGTYDGIGFLSALTSGLAEALPQGQNIITHAPQTPYWDPQGGYNEGYTQVFQKVGEQITWINNQFYNNPSYDATAALKVNWYQRIAAITGPQKLLVGVILDPNTEGYSTLDDMTNNVIAPLKATFGTAFGGAMGWEFSLDEEDQGGMWGVKIAGALGLSDALPVPGQEYTIQSGDTLFSIATAAYGAANADAGVAAIEAANPGIDPNDLQVGQQIMIPATVPAQAESLESNSNYIL
jgi:chitinase